MPPAEPTFLSPDELYQLHNYQNHSDLLQLTTLLTQPPGHRTPVILLAAESGIGRRYFLESALHHVRPNARHLLDSRLDLTGYEPTLPQSFQNFVDGQLKTLAESATSHATEKLLNALGSRLKASVSNPSGLIPASIVGISLSLSVSLADILLLNNDTFDRLPTTPPSDREALHLALKPLTQNIRLVLHIPNGETLQGPLRAILVNEWKSNPNLTLVFSCGLPHDNFDIALTDDVRRFELHPLDQNDIVPTLARQFNTKSLAPLARPLIEYSQGRPGLVARAMRRLITEGVVIFEQDENDPDQGAWSLAPEGLDHPAVAEVFLSLYEPVSAALANLPSPTRVTMEHFLWAAAICNASDGWFPIKRLFHFVGISANDTDPWIDAIDDNFESILEDLGYQHPAWPGELLYRFNDPALPAVLLKHCTGNLSQFSSQLIDFVEPLVPSNSREAAKLLLRSARFNEIQRERLEKQFQFEVGEELAEALTDNLRLLIAKKRENPDSLLAAALRSEDKEPFYRTLAIVNALTTTNESGEKIAVSQPSTSQLLFLQARLLFKVGRYSEAELLFGQLFEAEFRKSGERAFLHSLPIWIANAWVFLGDSAQLTFDPSNKQHPLSPRKSGRQSDRLASAERILLTTREVINSADGPDRYNLSQALHTLGLVKIEQGLYPEAERLLTEVLDVRKSDPGAADASIARAMKHLAHVKQELGLLSEAADLLKRALALEESKLGKENIEVAYTLHELGRIYYRQGLYSEAEGLLNEALRIKQEFLGNEQLSVAGTLLMLAALSSQRAIYSDAESMLERVLRIQKTELGEEHPDFAFSLFILSVVKQQQGLFTEAEGLIERALEIQKAHLGEDHPQVATILYRFGAFKEAQGLNTEAETFYSESLRIRRQRFGDTNPQTIEVLESLEQVKRKIHEAARANPASA